MLQSRVAEFKKSKLEHRLSIVRVCVEWIQARWQGESTFDYPEVEKVCSLNLGHTTILPWLLACPAVSIQ